VIDAGAPEQLGVPAGESGELRTQWFKEMLHWREGCRATIGYNGSLFEYPELQWVSTSYMQPQSHTFDRFLYDPDKHEYTVDRFLDDLRDRYGGIDSVLLWTTYPNIGLDDRNQFDMMNAIPGGVKGLRSLIKQLHKRNVKVLLPLKPWDLGSRRAKEGAVTPATDSGHLQQMAELLRETGADGINADTYNWVPEEYFTQSVRTGHPIAIEPEGGGTGFGGTAELAGVHAGAPGAETRGETRDAKLHNFLNYQSMSWGYWHFPMGAPLVDRWKWFDSRHMTHVCERWQTRRVGHIQAAYFNGVG
jgi:hypothetical protein